MKDFDDILDAHGAPPPEAAKERGSIAGRKWKSIMFRCCHVYGRMYRNAAGTEYAGCCPRCGVRVNARIGPGGTDRTIFEAI